MLPLLSNPLRRSLICCSSDRPFSRLYMQCRTELLAACFVYAHTRIDKLLPDYEPAMNEFATFGIGRKPLL